MRLRLAAAAAVLAVCRIAFAGDAVTAPVDFFAYITKIVIDYGALGLFVAFLLLDRKSERERRDRDVARWHEMDQRLIDRMEANTLAMQEMAHALKELRGTIKDNEKVLQGISVMLVTGSPRGRRAADAAAEGSE